MPAHGLQLLCVVKQHHRWQQADQAAGNASHRLRKCHRFRSEAAGMEWRHSHGDCSTNIWHVGLHGRMRFESNEGNAVSSIVADLGQDGHLASKGRHRVHGARPSGLQETDIQACGVHKPPGGVDLGSQSLRPELCISRTSVPVPLDSPWGLLGQPVLTSRGKRADSKKLNVHLRLILQKPRLHNQKAGIT